MVTSRFHKDEAVLQRDTMAGKVRSKRNMALAGEVVAMLAIFVLLVVYLGPLSTNPLYMPVYPAILVPLSFGAVFLATGAYFRKKEYDITDLSGKPALRSRFSKYASVYMVVSLALGLLVLIAITPFGDTNLAEQGMVSKQDRIEVGSNTYIRLQFQGSDWFGTYHPEVTVKARTTPNYTVPLDFYLMDKDDAQAYDPAIPPTNALVSKVNSTSFSHMGLELKAQDYVLVIQNLNNESVFIDYKIIQRTSDDMSLFIIVFFLAYAGIAGGWLGYLRTLAGTETVPVIAPPVPGPAPTRPPMPGPPQPGMRMAAQAAETMEPGPAPESGGVPMSITCPRCNTGFEVMRGAGPTKIKCPGCGKEGTLAGLPAAALAAARAQPAPAQAPAMAREPAPEPAPQYAPQYQEPQVRPEYPPARAARLAPGPAPQPYGQPGQAYPAPQPQSYAQPAPAAGDMYAQPTAPPAPALPQSPYDQLMAMGLAPAEPAIPVATAAPVAPPPMAPAPAPAVKKTIACPRCKQAFQIDKVEGPQHIRCPHCGKEGTIGARKPAAPAQVGAAPPGMPAAAAMPPAAPPAPAPAPRPAPAQMPRPAIQTPSPMAGAAPSAASGAVAPKMISCPACKRPFAVTETRRPIQVKCPSCGKEGVLRK